MIESYLLIFLLIAHFWGDFVCQTDWQAKNKSKSNLALVRHVITYSLVMLCFVLGFVLEKVNFIYCIWFVIVNGILHFLIDYVTSRINASLYKQNRIHYFFVGVGADQLCHSICLILTLQFLMQYNGS